jgi:hypothetical protein
VALAVSLGLFVFRIECIGLGPDPDTDAYGHYVIGRQLLDTALNLRIHWVWLPLYHGLLAAGISLGASLDHVRFANAVISTLTPLLLFALPRATRSTSALVDRGLLALAVLLAATLPIAVQMGTTGQPEALFGALFLGAAVALAQRRHALAAALLSAAVLTRYEAWIAVASVAAVIAFSWLRTRKMPEPSRMACVAAPLATIGCWVTARWLGGEPFLGFLSDNQRFAESALGAGATRGIDSAALVERLSQPQTLAWVALSAGAVLGVPRALRSHGVWVVALPASVIGFLALGWLTRSHLGLERHWVAAGPFVALWLANGLARASELCGKAAAGAAGPAFAGGSLLLVGLSFSTLEERLSEWQDTTTFALGTRRAAAHFVRSLPEDALIVCDEASVEVLSQLPRTRFMRTFVSDAAAPRLLALASAREVYVLSWRTRMSKLMQLGRVVYSQEEKNGDALVAVHLALPASARALD